MRCTKCNEAAEATLTYDYGEGRVWLDDLVDPPAGGLPLCATHAGRFSPPVGWSLADRRSAAGGVIVSLEVA